MNISFQLYQLQKIDLDLDAVNIRLKEIEKIISNNQQILNAEENVEVSQEKFVKQTVVFDQLNDEIEKKKIKISQSESMLYSGKVQNPKELEDLQLEIASLKNAIQNLEIDQMAALEKLENADENLQKAKSDLINTKSELATRFSMLTAEKQNLIQTGEGLSKKKESLFPQFSAEILNQYKTLRKTKGGHAVTNISDGSCGACGANLTASQQQSARTPKEMFICPNCRRIVYGSS